MNGRYIIQHLYTTILGFLNSHLQEDVPDNASE